MKLRETIALLEDEILNLQDILETSETLETKQRLERLENELKIIKVLTDN